MAECKATGNLALSPKENRVIVINPIEKAEFALLRVAAYCRVSSDSSDQMNLEYDYGDGWEVALTLKISFGIKSFLVNLCQGF